MAIYYLIGGEYIQREGKRRKAIEINKKILSESGSSPRVIVFPWSYEIGLKEEKRKLFREYFVEIGASEVNYIDKEKSFEELKKEVDEHDIVYLPGGYTKILMENAKKYRLFELLEGFEGIIVGNSAGAHTLSKNFFGMPGRDGREEIEIGEGLGILNITTTVHFEEEKEFEGINELKDKVIKPIYCIPENEGIRIEGKEVTVLSEGVIIIN